MTECNRCGDCCENMPLNVTKKQLRRYLATEATRPGGPRNVDHEANARFILTHWHRSGGGGTATRYSCDAFDPLTRLCTAHEERPPICQGYPWYGRTPTSVTVRLSARCSYNADQGVAVQIC